jgi:hypothetical protein
MSPSPKPRTVVFSRREGAGAQALGRSFFAAPDGRPDGNGKRKRPWDLGTALSQPSKVRPGDTIYLRGGTYTGKYVSTLVGAPDGPITVSSFPGEWAKIDGYIYTTLASPMTATQTTLTLADASGFPNGAGVRIDNELLLCNNKTGNSFTDVLRGAGGSTSTTSHAAGTTVLLGGNVLSILGSDTIFRDLEVMSSYPVRVDTVNKPDTLIATRGETVAVRGPRIKVINCILHDGQDGLSAWSQAPDSEFNGNIIYNSGNISSDRAHGHNLYHENASGARKITDNICFNSFDIGFQAFGVTGPFVGGDIEGNVIFGSGSPSGNASVNMLVGTQSQPIANVTIIDNFLYHAPGASAGNFALGYNQIANGAATVQGNYLAGGNTPFSVSNWQNLTFADNTIYSSVDQLLVSVRQPAGGSYSWGKNAYFDATVVQNCSGGNRRAPFQYVYNGALVTGGCGSFLDWTEWLAGIAQDGIPKGDATSIYVAGMPPDVVFIRPNQYDAKRANIIVYNWDRRTSMPIDVQSVLPIGAAFEIRNAEDYFNAPVLSGTYDGTPLIVPTTSLTVAIPIGVDSAVEGTGPEFNVFVLIVK